eukprot:5977840-Prymnesium_polylepis.1
MSEPVECVLAVGGIRRAGELVQCLQLPESERCEMKPLLRIGSVQMLLKKGLPQGPSCLGAGSVLGHHVMREPSRSAASCRNA